MCQSQSQLQFLRGWSPRQDLGQHTPPAPKVCLMLTSIPLFLSSGTPRSTVTLPPARGDFTDRRLNLGSWIDCSVVLWLGLQCGCECFKPGTPPRNPSPRRHSIHDPSTAVPSAREGSTQRIPGQWVSRASISKLKSYLLNPTNPISLQSQQDRLPTSGMAKKKSTKSQAASPRITSKKVRAQAPPASGLESHNNGFSNPRLRSILARHLLLCAPRKLLHYNTSSTSRRFRTQRNRAFPHVRHDLPSLLPPSRPEPCWYWVGRGIGVEMGRRDGIEFSEAYGGGPD